jgi:hypothetical protein
MRKFNDLLAAFRLGVRDLNRKAVAEGRQLRAGRFITAFFKCGLGIGGLSC